MKKNKITKFEEKFVLKKWRITCSKNITGIVINSTINRVVSKLKVKDFEDAVLIEAIATPNMIKSIFDYLSNNGYEVSFFTYGKHINYIIRKIGS